ncbi:hypothetical protein [Oceanobacter kriegii]|uniref:hypothetical protein n=1 Tax=Oceanobacter kriegii TaxID=64972 RepID=UPI0012EBB301|nr:hypothetical protein [Oceanobacter kriegii]
MAMKRSESGLISLFFVSFGRHSPGDIFDKLVVIRWPSVPAEGGCREMLEHAGALLCVK